MSIAFCELDAWYRSTAGWKEGAVAFSVELPFAVVGEWPLRLGIAIGDMLEVIHVYSRSTN